MLLETKSKDAGGVTGSIPLGKLVHTYALTDAHGRFTWILCRETGRLERLPVAVLA